jgi:hypothetical protein
MARAAAVLLLAVLSLVRRVVGGATEIALPSDADLTVDTASLNYSNALWLRDLSQGPVVPFTRADAESVCGALPGDRRYSVYRFNVSRPGTLAELWPMVSLDGLRIAHDIHWTVCTGGVWADGTDACPASVLTPTAANFCAPALWVLTSSADGGGTDGYDCVYPNGGCSCGGNHWDGGDVAVTVLIVVLLSLSFLLGRVVPADGRRQGTNFYGPVSMQDTDPVSTQDTDTRRAAAASKRTRSLPVAAARLLEVVAYGLVLAHVLDTYLRWSAPQRTVQILSLVAASALLVLGFMHWNSSSAVVGRLLHIGCLALFTAQTLFSVYAADLPRGARITSPFLCFVYVAAYVVDLSTSGLKRVPRAFRVALALVLFLGPATYALPMWGQECDGNQVYI